MQWNSSATELTTAATDAVLGFVCLLLIAAIIPYRPLDPWKVRLWSWVFGLLAAVSFLGAVAHGLDLRPGLRKLLWQPLYFALGIDVSLFILCGISDWLGKQAARRLLFAAIGTGMAFYAVTLISGGSFLVFVIYEAIAMISAMAIYVVIAVGRQMPGASTMAAGICLTIAAAALQASPAGFTLVWPFDHNSVFHLVQIAALIVLAFGLRRSLSRKESASSADRARAHGT